MPSFSATTGGTAAAAPTTSVGYRRAAARELRRTARARVRPMAAALRPRLRNVRHAEPGRVERGARLPRAQCVAPCGGVLRRRPRERRLVGQHDRSRQAAGYQPLLRHRGQQPGELLWLHRTPIGQSGHRSALGRRFSAGHGRRLGGRAGAARRPSRHRAVRRGDGRQPGRHASAGLGDPLSATDPPRGADRGGAQPVGAEHRVQRGGAAGDPHRPGFPRGPFRGARHAAAPRLERGAHDRPHHLPVRSADGGEVRPRPARWHQFFVRARVPDRVLFALPG